MSAYSVDPPSQATPSVVDRASDRRTRPGTTLGARSKVDAPLISEKELATLLAPLFARNEPRRQARLYVSGLLEESRRKNGRQIAGVTGEPGPWGTQRLLNRARWDADELRDRIRQLASEGLARSDGLLMLKANEVVKKGNGSVAVSRQYAESTRQVENCQLSILAGYASSRGAALIDRELVLPTDWAADPTRCTRAGVPTDRRTATSPAELAEDIVLRSIAANVPFSWVTATGRLGRDTDFRRRLDIRGLHYALEVPARHVLEVRGRQVRLDILAAETPSTAWRRHPATDGLWLATSFQGADADRRDHTFGVLVHRRRAGRTSTFRLTRVAHDTPLSMLVDAARTAESADASTYAAATQVGLSSYQVRTWTAWYRHVTLCLLALLRLPVAAPTEAAAATRLQRISEVGVQ
jgi:SRSO17 transposase